MRDALFEFFYASWPVAIGLLIIVSGLLAVHFTRDTCGIAPQVRLLSNLGTVGIVAGSALLAAQNYLGSRLEGKLIADQVPLPKPRERPDILLTFRDFLRKGKPEMRDLGLYSYLLFGNSGTTNREQRTAAAKAYLNRFFVYETTKNLAPNNQKNGFYMLTSPDAEWIDQCAQLPLGAANPGEDPAKAKPAWMCEYQSKRRAWSDDELARWIVDNYDYQRTAALLNRLTKATSDFQRIDGVYIVSYNAPLLSTVSVDSSKLLIQDLSRLKPDYMETWVQEVSFQFTKAAYWDVNMLRRTLLIIRTRLPEIADLVDLTGQAAASEWWKEKKK